MSGDIDTDEAWPSPGELAANGVKQSIQLPSALPDAAEIERWAGLDLTPAQASARFYACADALRAALSASPAGEREPEDIYEQAWNEAHADLLVLNEPDRVKARELVADFAGGDFNAADGLIGLLHRNGFEVVNSATVVATPDAAVSLGLVAAGEREPDWSESDPAPPTSYMDEPCPACGSKELFVSPGDFIACGLIGCPDPLAAHRSGVKVRTHPHNATPAAAGERDTTEAGEPEQMVTITPTGWADLDADDWPHLDYEGDPIGWCAITYRWPGDSYPSGAPEHWTWELVDPAGPVALDGTDTDDPAPFLTRLVDLLHADDVAALAARPAPVTGQGETHAPFNDDGILYCGYDGHGGCGEAWPCSFERLRADYERSQFLLRIAAGQLNRRPAPAAPEPDNKPGGE